MRTWMTPLVERVGAQTFLGEFAGVSAALRPRVSETSLFCGRLGGGPGQCAGDRQMYSVATLCT